MKIQLLCTFIRKSELESKLENINSAFNVMNKKVFLLRNVEQHNEFILSYNIITTGHTTFLPNSILVHRKKETNTIYTINALNELIMLLNNGILDRSYSIDWERYRNIMLLKNPNGLRRIKIERIQVYNLE